MKERPILFSGPMVRAILDGRKTQTRRAMKPQPGNNDRYRWAGSVKGDVFQWGHAPKNDPYNYFQENEIKCPYGATGDRLWVKETFYAWGTWEQYYDGNKKRWRFLDHTDSKHPVKYPATEGNRFYQGPANGGDDYHCRPSIFMKRKYSRIALEVTGVRVKRVQDISEDDAQKEGVTPSIVGKNLDGLKYRSGFQTLWDSINEKRGYGWNSNPFVWVVEFRVI
jgi:hypothetical protein